MVSFTVTKGSTVEVRRDEPGFYGAWYAATVVDILEASPTKKSSSSKKEKDIKKAGYLIKYDTLFEDENSGEHVTELVDPLSVRPSPPVMVDDDDGGDFEVNNVIDANHKDGWWIGVIDKVIVDGKNKKFVVAFENPREKFEFKKSQLRLHLDWVDGGWVVPQKKERNGEMVDKVEEASRGKRSQSSTGSKGNKKAKVPVMEASGTQAVNQNSVLVDQEMITTEPCSNSKQKKRGRPAKLKFPVTRPNGVQQGSSCPTRPHDEPVGATDEPNGAPNQANGGTTSEEWPFMKNSPVWAAIESQESYQKPPQKPHFSPLKEIKQDVREGLAIAQMVTFANMFQRISNLQLSDPNETINKSLETLADLETHGFDVKLLRARLNQLLHWKLEVEQDKGELKRVEESFVKCKVEKCQVYDKIRQLKLKMKELEQEMEENVKMKNVKDGQLTILQLSLHLVAKKILDSELAFEKLKATPF